MQEKSSGFQWPAQWTPDILATLMFVVQKGRILLIRKKRGIGAGKVNGPGGKFEPGETALQCVLREVREELHIDIEDAREMGVLNFSFACGTIPEIRCHVFMATSFTGGPDDGIFPENRGLNRQETPGCGLLPLSRMGNAELFLFRPSPRRQQIQKEGETVLPGAPEKIP